MRLILRGDGDDSGHGIEEQCGIGRGSRHVLDAHRHAMQLAARPARGDLAFGQTRRRHREIGVQAGEYVEPPHGTGRREFARAEPVHLVHGPPAVKARPAAPWSDPVSA
jgi:hypothetical protein